MLIEDKRDKQSVITFENISASSIFEYNNNFFMKLAEIVENDCGIKCNAIDLRTGRAVWFIDAGSFIPIKSKLIIDRYPVEE